MQIFAIRHAEAFEFAPDESADDFRRELTPAGVEAARALGRAMTARGVRPVLFLTSPLVRAKQTTDAVVAGLGGADLRVEECPALAPGGKARKVARAIAREKTASVALVGHQPDLGRLVAWLCGGRRAELALAKPSLALVECQDEPGKGCGELKYLVSPEWFAAAEATDARPPTEE